MFGKRLTRALAVTTAGTLIMASAAFADTVSNNLASVDATLAEMNLAVSGTSTVAFTLAPTTGDDDKPGCNLGGPSSELRLGISSSNPAVASLSPSSVSLTGCGTASSNVTVTGNAAGTATVTLTFTSVTTNSDATSASDYDLTPASFTVNVAAAGDPCDAVSAPTAPAFTTDGSDNDGLNGWFVTVPTVSATSSTAGAAISYSTDGTTFSATAPVLGEGETTVIARATSATCAKTSDTATTFKVDTVAPDIDDEGIDSGTAGTGGWYVSEVFNRYSASDATSGLGSFATPWTVGSGTAEGSAITIPSGSVTDLAGNTAASIDSAAFKIDLTDPQNSVTGVANGGSYTLGSVPTADCSTTDPGNDPSGVATQATVAISGGTANGVGTFIATCSGGSDNAGRAAANASVTYTAGYDLSGIGILQPINPDNSSLFSRGKAVPVKFRMNGDNPYIMTGWKLLQQQVNCSLGGDAIGDVVEAVAENPSNSFRYDSTANQYIYNANFKDKAVGTCWKAGVEVDSGQKIWSAIFRLQK